MARKNRLMTKTTVVLAVLVLGVLASAAAHARTTAGQVADRASLQAFVEGAKEYIEGITDVNEGAKLRERLRQEGDWKSGETFLVVFLKNGYPFIHGNDRSAESRNLLAVEDERGLKVVAELFAAAAAGGGFVEYHVDGAKTAYAVEYTSGITGRPFVLVGGYVQDVSHVPIKYADLPRPAVTAAEVVDRETLIAFVEEAAKAYQIGVMSENFSGLTEIRNAFRQEGGYWKQGSIYLWLVSGAGIILFHATDSELEGRLANVDRVDVNGVRFVHEMITGAREQEEGKFLEYNFDDPTIEGDEETGSPKIGYAKGFPVPNSNQKLIVGSGIFLSDDPGE